MHRNLRRIAGGLPEREHLIQTSSSTSTMIVEGRYARDDALFSHLYDDEPVSHQKW